jgi:hypothetical protein
VLGKTTFRILPDMPYYLDFGNDRRVEITGQEILDLLWVNYRAQFVLNKIDTNPITVRNQGSV